MQKYTAHAQRKSRTPLAIAGVLLAFAAPVSTLQARLFQEEADTAATAAELLDIDINGAGTNDQASADNATADDPVAVGADDAVAPANPAKAIAGAGESPTSTPTNRTVRRPTAPATANVNANNPSPETSPHVNDHDPTSTEPAFALTAIITAIENNVQFRIADDQPWVRAKVGDEVPQGGTFRTGLRSTVTFRIPPNQVVVVDRLTVLKVVEALQYVDTKRTQTNLGMPYGRTRMEVEEGGPEHRSTITSPSAVLSLHGTKVVLTDEAAFPTVAAIIRGKALFKNMHGRNVIYGGDGYAQVSGEDDGAADTSAKEGSIDPGDPNARTEEEEGMLIGLPSQWPIAGRTGSSVTRPGADNSGVVGGKLTFDLKWTSAGKADLDLFARSPLGEQLSVPPSSTKIVLAGGREFAGSGGLFSGDVGSVAGLGGETISWDESFPAGNYNFGVLLSSADAPAVFQLDVKLTFRNGNRTRVIRTLRGRLDPDQPIKSWKQLVNR